MKTIKKFDLEKMHNYPSVLIYGNNENSRQLVSQILTEQNSYDNIIVTSYSPEFYNNFITSPLNIRRDVSGDFTSNEYCDSLQKKFIVLDNINLNEHINQQWMYKLIYTGRHSHLGLIIVQNEPINIPQNICKNIDYVFVGEYSNLLNKKNIHQNFADHLLFHKFHMIHEECTKQNNFMVLNNTKIYWYSSTIPPSVFQNSEVNDETLDDFIKISYKINDCKFSAKITDFSNTNVIEHILHHLNNLTKL